MQFLGNINYKIKIKAEWLSDNIPDMKCYKICKFTIFNGYKCSDVDAFTIINPIVTFNHDNRLKPKYFKQCSPIAFANNFNIIKSSYTVCLEDNISTIFPQRSTAFYIGFIIENNLNIDFLYNNNTPSGFYIDDIAVCCY